MTRREYENGNWYFQNMERRKLEVFSVVVTVIRHKSIVQAIEGSENTKVGV